MRHFNRPASADPTSRAWPWRHVLRAHQDDFVVVKMDIDHADIENPLAAQIVSDPELYSRIDVLFWCVLFWCTTFNPYAPLLIPTPQALRRIERAHS